MKTLVYLLTLIPLLSFSQNKTTSQVCIDFQEDTIPNTSLNQGVINELIYETNGIKIYGNINNPSHGGHWFWMFNNLYVNNILATFDLTDLNTENDYKKITFLVDGYMLDTTLINSFKINGFDVNTLPTDISWEFENYNVWGILKITIEGQVSSFTIGPFNQIDDLCIESFESSPTTTNEIFNYEENIKFYPNPMTSSATIELPNDSEYYSLTIYDVLGNLVKAIENIHSKRLILEREGLTNGVYLYQLSSSNKSFSGRIIIK